MSVACGAVRLNRNVMTVSGFFKKIFSKILILNCLGMVLATGLLVGGTLLFLSSYTHHDQSVEVPALRGKSVDQALQILSGLGLEGEVTDTGYVEAYAGNVVLEQSLRAGQRVKAGRIVGLTINASEARAIALPDLADNSSRREAEAKLKAMGFRDVRVELIEGDQDWVYGMKVGGISVSSGARVPVTSAVTLVVGDGRADDALYGDDSLDYGLFVPESEEIFLEEGGSGYATPDSSAYDILEDIGLE